jgi:hypothetical protein
MRETVILLVSCWFSACLSNLQEWTRDTFRCDLSSSTLIPKELKVRGDACTRAGPCELVSTQLDFTPSDDQVAVFDEHIFIALRKNGEIEGPNKSYKLWVRSVSGSRLVAPMLRCSSPTGGVAMIVIAKEGTLVTDKSRGQVQLTLRECRIWRANSGRELVIPSFAVSLPFPVPTENPSRKK